VIEIFASFLVAKPMMTPVRMLPIDETTPQSQIVCRRAWGVASRTTARVRGLPHSGHKSVGKTKVPSYSCGEVFRLGLVIYEQAQAKACGIIRGTPLGWLR